MEIRKRTQQGKLTNVGPKISMPTPLHDHLYFVLLFPIDGKTLNQMANFKMTKLITTETSERVKGKGMERSITMTRRTQIQIKRGKADHLHRIDIK